VFTYDMWADGQHLSSSLTTIALEPDSGGISGAPFLLSVLGMKRLSYLGVWIAADQGRG
jgi:hypothetical protein